MELATSALLTAEDSFAIGRAASLLLTGDFLVVGDRLGDPHLVVFDLRTGWPIQRLGRDGEGPGEVKDPSVLRQRFGVTDSIQLFDTRLRRLSIYSVEANGLRFERHEHVPPDIVIGDVLPLRDRVAFTGLFSDAAVYVTSAHAPGMNDSLPAVYAPLGNPPFPIDAGTFVPTSRSFATTDRRGERLAIGFLARNQLQFHHADGSSALAVSDTVSSRLPIADSNEGVSHTVGMTATDARVFALFCGCRGELPREVLVYDWEGKLLGVLVLNREVYSITVSRDGRHLYGGIEEPEPAIGVWEVPDEMLPPEEPSIQPDRSDILAAVPEGTDRIRLHSSGSALVPRFSVTESVRSRLRSIAPSESDTR